MHLPLPNGQKLAPSPIHKPTYPWRFCLGDYVYVLDRASSSTYEVIGGELWCNFPHLHVRDTSGDVWRVPQLHCSSKTITFKKN